MITPMEIQNHEFNSKLRGYEKEAVRHFLHAVAEDYENIIEHNHKMAQELAILRERVSDMESRDKVLKDTLVTAQQVKTDIHDNAEKEAELIIKEAQLKADEIYEDARAQVDKVRRQMAEVRRVRNDLLAEAEMMVSRFGHFVEAERDLSIESDKLLNIVPHKKPAAAKQANPAPQPIRGVKTGS